MEVFKLFAFIVLFMITVQDAISGTHKKLHQKTKQHHRKMRIHTRGLPPNCHVVCEVTGNTTTNQNEEQESGEDYDDANDNETAIEMTSLPPGYYNDVYLNNEDSDDDDVRLDPENPMVDFIVIKHRFSNETNQAFPPYAFAGRNKKEKQTKRGKKKVTTKQHHKEKRKHWKKQIEKRGNHNQKKSKKTLYYP